MAVKKKAARPKPATKRDPAIDGYLEGVDPNIRALLQKLRKTIHAVVPDVEECISYLSWLERHRGDADSTRFAAAIRP